MEMCDVYVCCEVIHLYGLQVRQWADGKERNIRALISSLHTILWEGEGKWVEVGMHQLLQPDQVRWVWAVAQCV